MITGEWEVEEVYHTTGLGPWHIIWVVEISDGLVTFELADWRGNSATVWLPGDGS